MYVNLPIIHPRSRAPWDSLESCRALAWPHPWRGSQLSWCPSYRISIRSSSIATLHGEIMIIMRITVALKILKYNEIPFVWRMSIRKGSFISFTLRPDPRWSKAWAMARCAELQPGERVLDPMCGKVQRRSWTEKLHAENIRKPTFGHKRPSDIRF